MIVGSGFGGLTAARRLRRAAVAITIVDRSNHHVFQPLLYQVASAGLNPSDIAAPIRRILRGQGNIEVLLAEVESIDLAARVVTLDDNDRGRTLDYDYLILATGVGHSYFGHDDWSRHAPGLKTIEDALEIRRRVLYAFEAAERESDPAARRAWLTFVVVGAGPTGVEMAGALVEIARFALARDFKHIDPSLARILLVEAASRVLPTYTPNLSERALKQLERLGVETKLNTQVTSIDAAGVSLGLARVEARTVIWAAGVAASPLARTLGVPLDRVGRVLVEPDLTVPGHPEVSVIGDLASLSIDGKTVPGVAPAAMQMAAAAVSNLESALAGRPTRPFRYLDKGSLATIGRAAAVADLGRVQLWGLPAWLAWLFIHLLFLIGFRNRLLVMIEWAWCYFTYDRGARLITGRLPPFDLREK